MRQGPNGVSRPSIVWDTQVTYELRNASVALGILNVFDHAPPLTNQATVGQFWYDPRYADPRGRVFYAQVTYAFR